MKSSTSGDESSASERIDQRIRELGDWRGETLARMRGLIRAADPEIVEEWKWMGTPVWSHAGIVCTGESYQRVVKLTFAHGASLPDPAGLFNSSLDGNTRRAIDIPEGATVDADAFQALVQAAVARNLAAKAKPAARPNPIAKATATATATATAKPTTTAKAKPIATAKAKPKAKATAKPNATAKAKAKPNATAKPTAKAKPTATAKAKPTAQAKPTAKPTKTRR